MFRWWVRRRKGGAKHYMTGCPSTWYHVKLAGFRCWAYTWFILHSKFSCILLQSVGSRYRMDWENTCAVDTFTTNFFCRFFVRLLCTSIETNFILDMRMCDVWQRSFAYSKYWIWIFKVVRSKAKNVWYLSLSCSDFPIKIVLSFRFSSICSPPPHYQVLPLLLGSLAHWLCENSSKQQWLSLARCVHVSVGVLEFASAVALHKMPKRRTHTHIYIKAP